MSTFWRLIGYAIVAVVYVFTESAVADMAGIDPTVGEKAWVIGCFVLLFSALWCVNRITDNK